MTPITRAIRPRRRPEQRVDRWTKAVFHWPAAQSHPSVFEHEVVVRRRNIDPARLDRLAVVRMHGRQRAGTPQDIREQRRTPRGDMPDDKHGGREVARQARHQAPQRFQATD
jgi:hypothetical protein